MFTQAKAGLVFRCYTYVFGWLSSTDLLFGQKPNPKGLVACGRTCTHSMPQPLVICTFITCPYDTKYGETGRLRHQRPIQAARYLRTAIVFAYCRCGHRCAFTAAFSRPNPFFLIRSMNALMNWRHATRGTTCKDLRHGFHNDGADPTSVPPARAHERPDAGRLAAP